MKPFILLALIFLSGTLFPQKYEQSYPWPFNDGPCESYLNFLKYPYHLSDLKKDTLNYSWTKERPAARFIQSKTKLINAQFFDKQGKNIPSGSFVNGNGKIILTPSSHEKLEFTFKDSCLNDTTFHFYDNWKSDLYIFKNNALKKWIGLSRSKKDQTLHIVKYDEGIVHDTSFIYGFSANLSPIPFLQYNYDKYKGALWQMTIYDHGQVLERTTYKKNGSIEFQAKFKPHTKSPLNPFYKKCFE